MMYLKDDRSECSRICSNQPGCAIMNAADVMVPNVITVDANATIGQVADILLSNHISGAPVVGVAGSSWES